MSFDDEESVRGRDEHGECAAEIHRLEARIRELEEENGRLKAELAQERHTTKTLGTEILGWMRNLGGIEKLIDRNADSMHATLDQLSYDDLRASGGLPEAQALTPPEPEEESP